MQPAVAKKVYGVVMTSSPGWMPRAISATSSASVPEVTPMPNWHCEYAATSFSSASTSGPTMKYLRVRDAVDRRAASPRGSSRTGPSGPTGGSVGCRT